jgi:hypothetical protein
MYGLPPHTDLSFLRGRRLEQLALGEHQVQLRFDGGVTIDVEGDLSLDSATGGARDGHRLHVLLGASIVRAVRKGKGDLVLDFGEHRLEIHDSNDAFESYCITAEGRHIVV